MNFVKPLPIDDLMEPKTPLVSVIIPKRSPADDKVRNAEVSIAAQKYAKTETIVVRDTEGRGANWARNTGWRQARGEYLLFSDCDINWKMWALHTLLDALERDLAASYAYCGFRMDNADGSARIVGLGPFTPDQVRASSKFSTMSLFRAKNFPGFDESSNARDGDIYQTLLARDGRVGACVEAVLFSKPTRPGISQSEIAGKVVLCTFSGKIGDILWTLPALRELHRMGATVDLATMPNFTQAHDLIGKQPYIHKVFAIENWAMEHDDQCGAQPRIPPQVPGGYDQIHHLTYARRPQVPLILHAPNLLGIRLQDTVLPFLRVDAEPHPARIALAFNPEHGEIKQRRLADVRDELPEAEFVDVSGLPFLEAARVIKSSAFFFGCRSANWVVACGVGQRSLICEPEMGRTSAIFGCPWATERRPSIDDSGAFRTIAREWFQLNQKVEGGV